MKILRYILFPFTLVYAAIVVFRNGLYDLRIFKSSKFDFPIITIGNLSVGGTGKTPHTEYLIRLLKSDYKVATLSRGYGRQTSVYTEASEEPSARAVGDEPAQFKRKFKDVVVAVEKKRVLGVIQMLYNHPELEAILLDDAFQHRAIEAGFSILLTDYNKLYSDDVIVPTGTLRERRKGAKRADIIIVTKCPDEVSEEERSKIKTKLNVGKNQELFFTKIKYGRIYNIFTEEDLDVNIAHKDVLALTGIANPKPLYNYLENQKVNYISKAYRDHYRFSKKDAKAISEIFGNFGGSDKIILTTEKDATRIVEVKELRELPIYSIAIEVEFLKESEKENFNNIITNYVRDNKADSNVHQGENEL